jgi:hypothetical protein
VVAIENTRKLLRYAQHEATAENTLKVLILLVAGAGIEPATYGL